jgi:hypothetical protein
VGLDVLAHKLVLELALQVRFQPAQQNLRVAFAPALGGQDALAAPRPFRRAQT